MSKQVYLDYAAATPLDKRVFKAMQPYLSKQFANPSSAHSPGREADGALEEARRRVARILGAKPVEIVFTSGSTEAANLAVLGVAAAEPQARIVASQLEHEAVLNCLKHLGQSGRMVGSVEASSLGIVSPDQVASAVNDNTALVCIQYASNEIGTIQPIAKISAAIINIRNDRGRRGVRMPLYLYCDAAQAGELNLQVQRLGVDLLSMGASKIYGPRGGGFLYVRSGTKIEPTQFGGGQEGGLRSGSQNVPAAIGLATALELQQTGRNTQSRKKRLLRDWAINEILKQVPNSKLNGDQRNRLSNNLNISFAGVDGESLVAYLDRHGFAVATGSACQAADEKPSHVLTAIGLTASQAASSLRLSFGRQTTKADLKRFITTLEKTVKRLRQLSDKEKNG